MKHQRRKSCLIILVVIIIGFLLCANLWILTKKTMGPSSSNHDEEQYTTGIIYDQPSHHPPSVSKDNETLVSHSVSLVDEDHIISPASSSSCFRARKDTIPQSMHGNLTLPIINLGE